MEGDPFSRLNPINKLLPSHNRIIKKRKEKKRREKAERKEREREREKEREKAERREREREREREVSARCIVIFVPSRCWRGP